MAGLMENGGDYGDDAQHIVQHCLDCSEMDDLLPKAFSTCPPSGKVCFEILDYVDGKSLIPFIGGARHVPMSAYVPFGILWGTLRIAAMLNDDVGALLIVMMVSMLGFAMNATLRAKRKTVFFLSFFVSAVTLDAWTLVDHFGFLSQYSAPLLSSGGLMLYVLTRVVRIKPETSTVGAQSNASLRSKYCKCCRHRLEVFDHHCVWLDCDIAEGNHRAFLLFLMLALGNSGALTIIISTEHVVGERGWDPWLWSTAVFNAFMCFMMGVLFIFQLVLISINLTTNEVANRQRFAHLRNGKMPFYTGIFANWSSFLRADRGAASALMITR
eukprot:g3416.t1